MNLLFPRTFFECATQRFLVIASNIYINTSFSSKVPHESPGILLLVWYWMIPIKSLVCSVWHWRSIYTLGKNASRYLCLLVPRNFLSWEICSTFQRAMNGWSMPSGVNNSVSTSVFEYASVKQVTPIDSNIIHAYAVGHDLIIVNSFDVAIELCDKRSSIYSSRWVLILSRYIYGQ